MENTVGVEVLSEVREQARDGTREWVTLVEATPPGAPEPPVQLRRLVLPIAAAAIAVALIVAVVGSLVSRRIAEAQAVHDVAQLTDVLADGVIQPALSDQMPTDPARTAAALDPLVRQRLLPASVVRVKIWSPSGTVLYSDEPRLVGQTFPLEEEATEALTEARTDADISDLSRPENSFERTQGKLLEVYRPIWTPDGHPLLFETYFRYDSVAQRSHELWRGFAGVMLSSLLALLLLLAPLVWLLLNRARRVRARQEEVVRQALAASEEERRRIAASLHDGVVQQLAATSFAAAGYAEQAGDTPLGAGLHSLADTVRGSIAGLRSLLVDIYPPSLRLSGLTPALRDLARAEAAAGVEVQARIDEAAASTLPEATQEAMFRVAQEALRNAVRHAQASRVELALFTEGETVCLLVQDDGHGFTVAEPAGSDHFGLRLMGDAARRCGARLAVASDERGTALKLEVAA
ncbi:sensor histidine kinase [Jatrophihabitans sp. GAS493]|uniref:sensor histidine kinase n=1 Tax=Jatrophihabitans sp. GAS493 TaxID=1907575 RepID=UPI0012FD166C|nr:histidine kinase [Jatrophihabitans sp. GAS493]